MQQSKIFEIEFEKFSIDRKNTFADDSLLSKKKFFEESANDATRIQNFQNTIVELRNQARISVLKAKAARLCSNAPLVKISNGEQMTQAKFLKFEKLRFYKRLSESEHIS